MAISEAGPDLRKAITFLVCLLSSFGTGFIGFLGTSRGLQGWYVAIQKPKFTPPNWLFGPVWTVLYACIGIACFMIVETKHPSRNVAIAAYATQLVLNALWCWLFFQFQKTGVASAEIVLLWVTAAITMVLFWRIRPAAGLLFLPYVAWVGFASWLSYSIYALNK